MIPESFIKSDPDFFSDKLDKSPMYPNGVNGILRHISENYRYPEEAIRKAIEGKVYVTFLINPDGWIENVELIKSPNEIVNDEAIRVV